MAKKQKEGLSASALDHTSELQIDLYYCVRERGRGGGGGKRV